MKSESKKIERPRPVLRIGVLWFGDEAAGVPPSAQVEAIGGLLDGARAEAEGVLGQSLADGSGRTLADLFEGQDLVVRLITGVATGFERSAIDAGARRGILLRLVSRASWATARATGGESIGTMETIERSEDPIWVELTGETEERRELFVREQSDLIIAGVDGSEPSRHRFEAFAAAARMPVLPVGPAGLESDTDLAALVRIVLVPTDSRHDVDKDVAQGVLDDLYATFDRSGTGLWRALLSVLSVPWKSLYGLAKLRTGHSGPASDGDQADVKTERFDAHVKRLASTQEELDDRIAIPFMNGYRGLVIWCYLLGFVVVGFGLVHGTVKALESATWPAVVELALLLVILSLVFISERKLSLRQRAARVRHIVEQLRHLQALAALGRAASAAPPPPGYSTVVPSDGASGWYARSMFRDVGTPAPCEAARSRSEGEAPTIVRFDDSYYTEVLAAARAWVRGQRDYHEATAHRHEWLEELAVDVMWSLFALVIIVVGLKVAHWMPGTETSKTVALFVIVLGPALLGAVHAIGVQIEFLRLATRSKDLAEMLSLRLEKRLGASAEPNEAGWSVAQRGDLESTLSDLSTLMLAEVLEWRAIYLLRELLPP